MDQKQGPGTTRHSAYESESRKNLNITKAWGQKMYRGGFPGILEAQCLYNNQKGVPM